MDNQEEEDGDNPKSLEYQLLDHTNGGDLLGGCTVVLGPLDGGPLPVQERPVLVQQLTTLLSNVALSHAV
ncbi:hypothetical protein G6F70_009632 [Rhizopus microsporus]|nr:hypothetical protein G6F71_009656 [Rhizopus microsporus]KAG1185301.1 hypothetical protein G6F70_009632 [Rhizopus microsporus]